MYKGRPQNCKFPEGPLNSAIVTLILCSLLATIMAAQPRYIFLLVRKCNLLARFSMICKMRHAEQTNFKARMTLLITFYSVVSTDNQHN